jgi:hypothetical protein
MTRCAEAAAFILGEHAQCAGNEAGENPRALAAAEDEQAERLAGGGRAVRLRGGDHRLPHRIADMRGLACSLASRRLAEAGRHRCAETQDEPVGAPYHRVLLVHDDRDAGQPRGEERRHGRIAAEADDESRLDPPQKTPRTKGTFRQRRDRARHRHRGANRERRGGDAMRLRRRYALDQLTDPRIGGKMNGPAAPDQDLAQRQSGEEMPSGPAGHEQRNRRHACLRCRP